MYGANKKMLNLLILKVLQEHSDAEHLLRIKVMLAPEISDESCVIVALLHDLGKAGMPGMPQYLRSEPSSGERASRSPYHFNRDLLYLSVPIRGLYLAASRFPLTEEEVQAIVYHDGQSMSRTIGALPRGRKS